MAQSANPFDQFDAPANAGPQVLIPESGVVTEGREVDLNNSRLNGRRTEQQIRIDAENAARAAQAEERQRQALAANMYLKGLRLGANGQPERIPGWVDPNGAKKPGANGALDSLVNQIKETRRLFAAGPGSTKGLAGLRDILPGTVVPTNGQFDIAASQLEDQAAAAFKVPGMGAQSDADAARIARSSKPSRFNADAENEQLFKGLQARVDAMRAAQGLPAAQWDAQAAAAQGQPMQPGQQTQPAMMVPGAGTTPPQTPQGPAGYDVGAVAGAPSGGTGGGGNFASAAGVAMAKRLSQAYTKGAGVQELNRLLSDNGFQTFSDPGTIAAIQKRGRLNFAPPVADDTRGTVGRALGGLADSAGGAYAISAADALTAGTLDNIAGGQSGLAMEYARQQYPGASLAGTVTGGALGAAGAEMGLARAGLGAGAAALGGDALYGAAYGAGSTEDGSRLLGAAGGGLGALAGGAAGRGIARGVGGLATGIRNADVQMLRQRGVPLTAGQAVSQSGRLGAAVKTAEDLTTGLPGVGTMTNARRLEGFEGFNSAAFDEGLAGINANTGGVIREQGVDIAQDRVGGAFDQALDGVNVQADAPFVGDMRATVQAGRALPDPMRGNAAYTLPTRVGNSFDTNGGLTGNGFQQSMRGLRQDAASLRNEPYGADFEGVTRQAEGALEGLLNRQAPDVLPAYQAANGAYRNTEILRDAVNRARVGTRVGEPGVFAPSQLAGAAAANSKKFGNSQGTTRQPFFDLTRAGQRVLTSKVADSGTAGRAAMTAGIAALGAGGTGYAAGGVEGAGYGTLGLAGLLAAGGSRAGQRALTAALLDRPEMLIRAGNGIANRARIGGLFGAPMLAGAGASLATQ